MNVLNIINDAEYRKAFLAEKGFMSDYNSEELVVTAILAKEPKWIEAIKSGHDLHSINAQRIFPEWNSAELPDCEFKKTKKKCKCPKHKELRAASKTASFGTIYGISKYGLAFKIHSSVEEADRVIKGFFAASPNVQRFLRAVGNFAIKHLYYPTPGFGSCRFVPHRMVFYDRPSIMRTSGNFSIQGTGAEILKVATVLILRHIRQKKHVAFVILIPYDEIIMEVEQSIAEYWKIKLQYFMELAGKLILKTDLLKADVPDIEDYWKHE